MNEKLKEGEIIIDIYDILLLIILIIISLLIFLIIKKVTNLKSNIKSNKHINIDNNINIIEENDILTPPSIIYNPPEENINIIPILPDRQINIRTRGGPLEYQQLGILTSVNNTNDVRPLFGRQTYSGSNQWNYYSASGSDFGARIPIFYKNEICTDSRGCREIMDGEYIRIGNVSNEEFIFTKYSNNEYDYIPYIY
jgi:hypothetical protein